MRHISPLYTLSAPPSGFILHVHVRLLNSCCILESERWVYGSVKVRRVYKLDKFESQYENDRPGVETTIGTFDQLQSVGV